MAPFSMVVSLLASLAGISAATWSCGKPLPSGQAIGRVSNVSIESGGLKRNYLISVPPLYRPDTPNAVIFSFHGGDRMAEDQMQLDQLTNPEFNTKHIVVYPQGVNEKWQGVPNVTTNDVQFTTDILNKVESSYCVDKHRIWATGKSDGGGFTNVLACDAGLSKRIAAFAPVSGAYYIDTLPCAASTVKMPCNAARSNIPLLAFHGGNDTTIPYTGGERKGECLPTIPHFIQEWAARDKLDSSKNITTAVSSNTVDYSFGLTGLVRLVYDSVIGHDWPSTLPNADNEVPGHHPASFNATPIILDFFDKHSLVLA